VSGEAKASEKAAPKSTDKAGVKKAGSTRSKAARSDDFAAG
jgi:hypothetical protein